jgi:hypothetical protein
MVDFLVGKILDSLDIENDLFKRWEWEKIYKNYNTKFIKIIKL